RRSASRPRTGRWRPPPGSRTDGTRGTSRRSSTPGSSTWMIPTSFAIGPSSGIPELGPDQRSGRWRFVLTAGAGHRPGRAQDGHHRATEARARKRLLPAGSLVDAPGRSLDKSEELRGPAQSLLEPEAPGRLALGGLRRALWV